MRQLVDEADRIGHHHLLAGRQLDPTTGGIEGGEQHVGGIHVRIGQDVEERALAGVGVAHQRDRGDLVAVPVACRRRSVTGDVVELRAHLLDLLADEAPVRLELALTRSAGPDATTGAREVGPHPRQPRQVVFERGQLDLQAPLARPCVPREDVDDQRRTVEHLAVEQRLEATLLVRGELVVDDEQVEVAGRLLVDQLRRAALAEVPHRVGIGAALVRAAHHGGPGRLGQGGELRQRALHRPAFITGIVEADEEGALDRGGEVDHAGAFGHLFDRW